MADEIFELRTDNEYIELIKLLKLRGIAPTGGQAKLMVEDGLVLVNGIPESRKRKKIRAGDQVEAGGIKITIKN